MTRLFGWPPFKLYAVDADTGKPLDPNVGRKTYVTYYDVKKDKNGKAVMTAKRTPTPSAVGAITTQDVKKNGNGKANGNGNGGVKGGNGGNGKKDDEKKDAGGKGGGNHEDKEWTPAEDAKLKEMKAEGKSWKEIATEFGVHVGQIKKRWNQIKDTVEGGGDDKKKDESGKKGEDGGKANEGGDGGAGQTKKEKRAAKKAEAEKAKEAETKNDEKKEKSKKASSKAGSVEGVEPRFTMGEWQILQEDDLFSFGELQCLSELIMKDRDFSWLRIAGAFYDTTGRRVHPEDIREKFEAMAAMG